MRSAWQRECLAGVMGKLEMMSEFPGQRGEGSMLQREEVGCERPWGEREPGTRPALG